MNEIRCVHFTQSLLLYYTFISLVDQIQTSSRMFWAPLKINARILNSLNPRVWNLSQPSSAQDEAIIPHKCSLRVCISLRLVCCTYYCLLLSFFTTEMWQGPRHCGWCMPLLCHWYQVRDPVKVEFVRGDSLAPVPPFYAQFIRNDIHRKWHLGNLVCVKDSIFTFHMLSAHVCSHAMI